MVPVTCAQCGCDLSSGSVDGLCAACLVRCALEDHSLPADFAEFTFGPWSESPDGRAFGRYELLDVLGRGGMGVVYRARERATGRVVALKLATPHLIAHDDFRRRFLAEMRAAASLDHPHVLPVFEVGEHDGVPFFTMKLADGGSLATRLGDYTGRHRAAAELVALVARAVEHAHQHRILHRDLKPANILLGANGHPYVSDFGLVKWMTADATLTASAVVVGAPGYIAPEQARPRAGHPVGPGADVFSLGVVLYELLTGKKPFAASTLGEALDRVENGSYAMPRSLVRDLPHDLEVICRKCLESDPQHRYLTAALLAEDLESFLAGRSIRARPAGTWAQTWKWARRNPAVAGLGAGLIVLLVAGVCGATIAAINLARARDRAELAEEESRERLWHSLRSEARALQTTLDVGHRHRALAALQRAAGIRPAPELRDEAIRALTLTDLRVVAEWKSDIPFGAFTRDLACHALELPDNSCEVRRTSDHTTVARLAPPDAEVFACWRFTPDGETLSIIGKGDDAWLWRWRDNDLVSIPYPLGSPPVCLEFSPDGKTIAAPAAAGGVALYDLRGGHRKTLAPEIAHPWAFAFAPDGGTLAVSDRASHRVTLVNTTTGATIAMLPHAEEHAVSAVGFSPDGRWLAAASTDATITLWRLADRSFRVLHGHSRICENLIFTPDSRVLASSGYDQTIRFWDVATGQSLLVAAAANASPFFDTTGTRLAIATEDSRWVLFDFLANDVCRELEPATHRDDNIPVSLAVDETARLAVVGGYAGVRIYDLRKGREVVYLASGRDGRHDVAFDDRTGDIFATVNDEVCLRWAASRDHQSPSRLPTDVTPPHEFRRGAFRLAGLDASSRQIALSDIDGGRVHVLALPGETGSEHALDHPAARDAVFAPGNRWMLLGGWRSPRVSAWSMSDWRHHHDVRDSADASFGFGDEGQAMLIGTAKSYRIFDTHDWTLRHLIPRSKSTMVTGHVAAAAQAPLGACQWSHDSLRLLDLRTGQWLGTLPVTITTGLDQFELDGAGTSLVIVGGGHVLQRWDLQRLRTELAALGMDGPR